MVKTQNDDLHQKPLVIIPAAGYGRRAGLQGSKELLPGHESKPLINHCLQQAADRNWPVHLITRKEKTDLIAYVEAFARGSSISCHIQIIEPSREWPETVLMSQEFWQEKNILCLPDTIYSPNSVFDRLSDQSNVDIVVAGFYPERKSESTWGFFRRISDAEFEICEKPNEELNLDSQCLAWGLLSFKKAFGKALFEAQLESTFDHRWKTIKARMLFSELSFFEDQTRQLKS